MNYNLTAIRPKAFMHTSAFREVMESLSWALSALGHAANITENWISKTETNIIFGAELLAPNQPERMPAGTMIYNLEQPSHPNLAKVKALVHGQRLQVWDYSKTNYETWRAEGADVRYVPIGYTPNLTRIPKAKVQDIDVLFLGWLTPRRTEVIQQLRAAGLNVVGSDHCYGGGRDELISRAKVCLNVHHDGRNLFEIVRVSYLLANHKCVVSEVSADDAEYSDLHIIRAEYDELVETCSRAVSASDTKLPFKNFAARDYVKTVKSALAELSPQEKVARRYAQACKEGDMRDFAVFLQEHAKGTCLEIGTRDGASTSALLSGVSERGGVVLSVDVAECGHLFAGHPQWKFIRTSSQNPKLKVPEIDLLLIDGDHSREGYRADLERFYPMVKPGGLILSHDIHPEPGHEFYMVGLREEFFAFANRHGLEHYELPGYAGMGVMVKPDRMAMDLDAMAAEEQIAQATA